MIHPSYVELMKVVNDDAVAIGEEPVVNSRYSIVSATAKRARQIVDGAEPMVRIQAKQKPLSIAVDEMWAGELKILTPEEVAVKEEEKRLFEEEQARRKALEEEERRALEAQATEDEKVTDQNEDDAEDTDEDDAE